MSEYGVNGQHALADLLPTEHELAELAEVMAEIEDEGDDGYGPWDDQADLSNVYDYSGLGRAAAALDATMDAEAGRLGEDIQDAIAGTRRPKFEDKRARAFDRLARGSYAPSGVYAMARDGGGAFASGACGDDLDAFGRCASCFHQVGCREVTRQEAAVGSARAVEAWRDQLLANQETSGIGLAAPALDTSWEDLLGQDGGPGVPADWSTIAEMRRILGLPASRELPNPADFPDGGL
jgi:hypothetical protein